MKVEALFGTFIVIVLIVVFAMLTLTNVLSTQNVGSREYNATERGITTFETFSNYMPIFIFLMVGIFIIGLIFFIAKNSRRSI